MGKMPDAEIEIGFFFKRSAWGRGYATEVCKRMLRFAFQAMPLNEVVASVHEKNVASMKVLEKSGLIDCGRMLCYGKDSLIYRITRHEWNEIRRMKNSGPPRLKPASGW
jgi:RimJ/RimL family protein N-acetyltransferase